MDEENNSKELEFERYLISKYWLHYLSAIEKITLQSFREDIVEAYRLTDKEKKSLMYIEGRTFNLRKYMGR